MAEKKWEIVIAGDDGTLYKLDSEALQNFKVDEETVGSEHYARVREQLTLGMVAGVIPGGQYNAPDELQEEALTLTMAEKVQLRRKGEKVTVGGGSVSCYLLDLASLKTTASDL